MERPKRARSSFDHAGIARTRSSTPTSRQNSEFGVAPSTFSSRNRSVIDSSTDYNSNFLAASANGNANASPTSAARPTMTMTMTTTTANNRRHIHQMSLPQYLGLNGSTMDSPDELSPFEERFLGRAPRSPGIPLAGPNTAPPTVVGKLFSGVKRAVTLKKDKNPVSFDIIQEDLR